VSPTRIPRRCRLCAAPAVGRGRCDQHALPAAEHRTRSNHIYGTRRWRRMARQHLAEHPFCVCGCDRLAEVVDHIRPHRGDVALAFDADNLQSMTRACHGRKTRLETAGGESFSQRGANSAQCGAQRETPMRRMSSDFKRSGESS
jgi:5-methylcytosine-specific restriction protein A